MKLYKIKIFKLKYLLLINNLSRARILPIHCLKAFPANPGLHWQLKSPGVFVQIAFLPHLPEGPFTASHSFMSR